MKKLTRIVAFTLCLVMLASTAAFAVTLPQDVTGDKNLSPAVQALMEAGAITGDTDGLFHPTSTLTRAQVCCMLIKLINPSSAELNGTISVNVAGSGFTDMAGYGWAAPYINYAARNEIAKGYPGNTFNPGGEVTMAELITFTLRAAGYTDEELGGTWPANFVAKAQELQLLSKPADLAMVTETGATPDAAALQIMKATKAQAAMVIYNAMELIKEANKPADLPQGSDQDKTEGSPDISQFTYVESGKIDADMTKYGDTEFAKDVKVYVYGLKKNYKASMEITDDYDFFESNIYKYKGVSTSAYVKTENGKITEMIVPGDVGFSGRIYCVINNTDTQLLNYEGNAVRGITTYTAGKEIMWLTKADFGGTLPDSADYLNGMVVELFARDGEIHDAAFVVSGTTTGTIQGYLVEIETAGAFTAVDDAEEGLIKVNSNWYEVNKQAAIYVLEDGKYTAGNFADVKEYGAQVRLYDISDNEKTAVDIIVVKR